MDDGTWQPPGGLLEPRERIRAGLLREVKEETGVTIYIERLSGLYESPKDAVISVVFRCRYRAGNLAISQESRSVAWVKRLEVTELVNEAFACRILDGLEEDVVVRTTDEFRLL
jgi:ADP-ribose pyrophosphatase YjhB (NUDIX family)